jgi:hypothetical protein
MNGTNIIIQDPEITTNQECTNLRTLNFVWWQQNFLGSQYGVCTQWRSWLRHCTTSQKVVSSIPNGIIGIFHRHNPSGCTMALGLTQPRTEMSTRNISSKVKAAGATGWQPYHLHMLTVLKSGSLNLLEPSGPVQACNGIALPVWSLLHAAFLAHRILRWLLDFLKICTLLVERIIHMRLMWYDGEEVTKCQ